ncbi:hypothetical protein B9479_007648 [Cryptococcus floricola]|uniref:Uncharacterized protein n=1 Tax=Cryptococcus floricola TaxID=2591691 RepID=A0A5D3AQ03_9TREE|nr:hypothetical protein B9479_007648 [Cryptococcus floricola]
MSLFFETFDNTLLLTGSPAETNTSSEDFLRTLFSSNYETDTPSLPPSHLQRCSTLLLLLLLLPALADTHPTMVHNSSYSQSRLARIAGANRPRRHWLVPLLEVVLPTSAKGVEEHVLAPAILASLDRE